MKIAHLTEDVILTRLSIIKLLYHQGIQQFNYPELTSFFSILTLHDSVEMFIILIAKHKGLDANGWGFMKYWDEIEGLSMKEAARELNDIRKSLKHQGRIPAKMDVGSVKSNITAFFHENSMRFFNIAFEDISLIELINNKPVKELLINSERHIRANDYKTSIKLTTEAFYKLIDTYKKSKSNIFSRTPLDLIQKTEYRQPPDEKRIIDRKLEDVFKKVHQNFVNIEYALVIIALGFDYKKYMMFHILTPTATKTNTGDYILGDIKGKRLTKENCEFCLNYVVECGLKLQEFDFKYSSLVNLMDFAVNPSTESE